jgi:hypothetical protein
MRGQKEYKIEALFNAITQALIYIITKEILVLATVILGIYYWYIAGVHKFTVACGGTIGWGTVLKAERSRVRFPMVSLDFFH